MDRKCKICGGTDKLVDVYHMPDMKFFGEKQDIGKPDTYCNTHFLEHVWYKNRKDNTDGV